MKFGTFVIEGAATDISFPQRLKPRIDVTVSGAAEAAPFHSKTT
jgi:hypothetical protein